MSGAEEISKMMIDFKENPVKSIGGARVVKVDDYNTSTSKNLVTGEVTEIDIPKSNVLIYTTEDGTRMAARPSGTEPKIKFYFSINTELDSTANFKKVDMEMEARIDGILKELKLH